VTAPPHQITAAQLRAHRRAHCRHPRHGFWFWFSAYFVDDNRRPLVVSRGQRALVQDIQRVLNREPGDAIRGLAAMCARGHGKSTLMKAAIVYALVVKGFRYAAIVAAGTVYKQFSDDIRSVIRGEGPLVRDRQGQALLLKDWDIQPSNRHPNKDDRKWQQANFTFYVGGWDRTCKRRVAVRGMNGGNGDVRGLVDGADRPDLLWTDDPMKDAEAANMEVTEKIKSFVKGSYWPCGGPDARTVTTGTPFNEHDLITSQVTSPGDWPNLLRRKLPAEHPLTGALYMPHYWTRDKLASRRELVGSRAYAEQYLLDPQGGGVRHFEPAWIERWMSECPERIEVHNGQPEVRCRRVQFTDPSLGRTKQSDYSAIVLSDYDRSTSTLYVRTSSIERRRPQKIVEDHLDYWQAWQPDEHGIEDEGAWELLLPLFDAERKRRNLPEAAIPQLQSTGGVNKVQRIKTLSPLVEFGRIRFAKAREPGHPEYGLLGDGDHRALRLQAHGWQGLPSGNEVDDGLDALEHDYRMVTVGMELGVT
jgi:hypothetical protein